MAGYNSGMAGWLEDAARLLGVVYPLLFACALWSVLWFRELKGKHLTIRSLLTLTTFLAAGLVIAKAIFVQWH